MRSTTKPGLALFLLAAAFTCQAQTTTTLSLLEKTKALPPDLRNGEHLYIQYCSACHHRSGWGSGPREVPSLAGQQDLYLLEQLIQFSTLDRRKDEMHEVVTRPEIAAPQSLRDVSAYAAQLPRNPDPDRGDGAQLRRGERLYTQSCLSCHGQHGEGSREDLIPAIGGQQYGYLLVRLHNLAQEHNSQEPRAELPPAIINLLAKLSPAELKAIADYTSRLLALHAP
jgi:cytochrome c553